MKIQKYYDQFSEKYDSERKHGYFDFVNRMEAAALRDFAQGKSVLEIGCGTGLILQQIQKEAESAVGVDLSRGMLQSAAAKGLSVARADAVALPFKDNSFDVVCSFKVLAHVKEIKKALQEIDRVTKENGFAVIEFYNSRSIKRVTNLFVPKKIFLRYDSMNSIKRFLPGNLRIVGIKGIRVIAPSAIVFRLPGLSTIFRFVEKKLSGSFLTIFGSYLVVVCKKTVEK